MSWSCRIVRVTQSLRQFDFGLGKDYMPGDLLFAPYEEDLLEEREKIRVTTQPHSGDSKEVPRSRVERTDFVVLDQPIMKPLHSAHPRPRSSG